MRVGFTFYLNVAILPGGNIFFLCFVIDYYVNLRTWHTTTTTTNIIVRSISSHVTIFVIAINFASIGVVVLLTRLITKIVLQDDRRRLRASRAVRCSIFRFAKLLILTIGAKSMRSCHGIWNIETNKLRSICFGRMI